MWDDDLEAYCSNGDGNLATDSVIVDVIDIAVDEDGYCWEAIAYCAECMTKETA